jgi:hypothetical protein
VIPGERWWAEPPLGQATYLTDVDPGLLSVGLDPVPADAPAILRFRPAAALRVGQYVNAFLDAPDEAALGLFPRWLPGAGPLDGPSSLSVAAVRALAAGLAGRSAHFGPFLAAEPALLTRRRLARLDAPSGHAAGRHPHCEPRPGHPGLGSPDDRQVAELSGLILAIEGRRHGRRGDARGGHRRQPDPRPRHPAVV